MTRKTRKQQTAEQALAEANAATRFTVVKDGRKWYVHDAQVGRLDEAGSFKTKHEAEAEAAANAADVEPKLHLVKPEFLGLPSAADIEAAADQPGKTQVGTVLTPEAIAAMGKLERIDAAKAEVAALREFGGRGPGAPATPVLDWMTNPDSKPTTKKASGAKAAARTPEQDKLVADLITAGRQCEPPVSWAKIAQQIEAQGIPTNRGGKWYDTTVSDLAKKLAVAS